jgi:hypothetical protein
VRAELKIWVFALRLIEYRAWKIDNPVNYEQLLSRQFFRTNRTGEKGLLSSKLVNVRNAHWQTGLEDLPPAYAMRSQIDDMAKPT